MDDTYAVKDGTVLAMPARGVLRNDLGVQLTAVLDAGPQKGTLALNPDGSFTYTPNRVPTGESSFQDTFQYHARSANFADSEPATVRIVVVASGIGSCQVTPENQLVYTGQTAYTTGPFVVDSWDVEYTVAVYFNGVPLAGALTNHGRTGPDGTVSRTEKVNRAVYGTKVLLYANEYPYEPNPERVSFGCSGIVVVWYSPIDALSSACWALFHAKKSQSGQVQDGMALYRGLRDQVLAGNHLGRDYASLYYRFRPELAKLILSHPSVLLGISNLAQRYGPLALALQRGEKITVSREDFERVRKLFQSLESVGSSEFRAAVRKVQADLRDPRTLETFGVTLRETTVTRTQTELRQTFSKLPLHFESTRGQEYVARGPGYDIRLHPTTTWLALRAGAHQTQTVTMKLEGAAARARITPEAALPGVTNYFLGQTPAAWRTGVKRYGRIRYQSVYPGVDLVYYGNQRELEYDLIVAPGASPAPVKLAFAGVEHIQAQPNGDLMLSQRSGHLFLRKPVVYQVADGLRRSVEARYAVLAGNRVAFRIGDYNHALPLVIDPVLSYASFLGGSGIDSAMAIAVDASGNAYVTGGTTSANLGATSSAPAKYTPGGKFGADGFVTKFDPTGSTVLYSTYFGGSGDDVGLGIAVDAQGNAHVTGATLSTNFPTTGAIQKTSGGGNLLGSDAFVLKLDPTGSRILYSTYLGGSGDDGARGIAVDPAGNAYIAGVTASQNFPLMNPRQSANGGGPLVPGGCLRRQNQPRRFRLALLHVSGGQR